MAATDRNDCDFTPGSVIFCTHGGKSMIKSAACVLCGALSLYLAVSAGTRVLAADSVAPVRLDRDKMAGLGLTAIPPDAYKDILVAGELNMRVAKLFEGRELRAEIFE
jgi:hypothetical protein